MKNLTYNLSPGLKSSLQSIELLRKDILTAPISPKDELRLRWEAIIQLIYNSLSLANVNVSKAQVIDILQLPQRKEITSVEKDVIYYKKAIDFLRQNWLVVKRNVTVSSLDELAEIAHLSNQFELVRKEMPNVLRYVQAGNDHPIICASVVQSQIDRGEFAELKVGIIGRLASLLILYKNGYDFRGLFVPEEFWADEKETYRKIINGEGKGDLSGWLEYFAQTAVDTLEKAKKDIEELKFHIDVESQFFLLTERQKSILAFLDNPKANITNRLVQKEFKVSQITASRDLSKLSSLGLLYQHGRGRSVYYTKV